MAKQGSMDMFLKRKNTNVEPEIDTDYSNSSDSDSADINESEASSSKRLRTSFTRKYDSSYIRFGFVVTDDGFVPKPQCVICGEVLSNDAMKPSKLMRHLNTKHKDKSSKPTEFFERKREEFKNRQKLIFKVSPKTNIKRYVAATCQPIRDRLCLNIADDVCGQRFLDLHCHPGTNQSNSRRSKRKQTQINHSRRCFSYLQLRQIHCKLFLLN